MTRPFSIAQPRRIQFGRGEALAAVPEIAALGRHAFLVHGRTAERALPLVAALEGARLAVTAHPCPGEPTLAMLDAGVEAARDADLVIGFGGGSALDLAKAIAALVPAPGGAMDHLEVVGRGRPLEADPLSFVAIPTTAGTGAEVTKNAVIDVPEHRRKVSLRDDRMIARLAIVDPSLTDHCPKLVTLASGLDAVVQVIEPYLSAGANPYTDALSRAAIPTGLIALRQLMAAEDSEARDGMAWVSLSGGLALANAGLGAVHGLAGPIGGMTGAAHGAICGALLPHVLRLISARAPSERLGEIMRWIDAAFDGGGIGALEDWAHGQGLPRLSALGLQSGDHAVVAEAALASSSMKASPVPFDIADLRAILERAG
ncbi:iron-containing alcohol dehydrogenase [Defluviimonas sp. SAOS-178_SWC]|uniref:iron-containing alcohol dehydrogenase n=1 Tax=Defluviimonas sp. SAOS-178_SWC TaxID=3121287 RepID=UPI003221CA20